MATIQDSLGKFWQVINLTDSVLAAKFDVRIEAPEEFRYAYGEHIFEHYFISSSCNKTLYFQISNHGEVDILCTPHIPSDIWYLILVSGEEVPEFIVKAGEAESFQLVIMAEGLDINIKETEFFVDIQQV